MQVSSEMTGATLKSDPECRPDGLKKARLSVWTVFCMIFCMCAAGAYGLEDMISSAGPGMTLLILMILPFFWSIPLALIAAELGSAIPEEGGYYKWVQRGLGEFWGFQAGWWRTLSVYVDTTVYVVLGTSYIQSQLGFDDTWAMIMKFSIIIIFTAINIYGVREVGRFSVYFSVIVIFAFAVITVLGFMNWQYNPFDPILPPGESVWTGIGLGMAIAMWSYSGYESMSTVAGELENPQVIPKATLLALPAISLVYILPTMTGIASMGNWQDWYTDGGINFNDMLAFSGLPWLGLVFAAAVLASNLSMYNVYLASGSRGFFVMSTDNLCPPVISKVSKRFGTPHIAIISLAVVNLILCQYGYATLVVIDVFLFMAAYIMIFIAAIALRIKEPNLHRPMRIRVNTIGLTAMCVMPILIAVWALFSNGVDYLFWGLVATSSGPIAYFIFRRRYGGLGKCDPGQTNQKTGLAPRDVYRIGMSLVVLALLAVGGYSYVTYFWQETGWYVNMTVFLAGLFALAGLGTLAIGKKLETTTSA